MSTSYNKLRDSMSPKRFSALAKSITLSYVNDDKLTQSQIDSDRNFSKGTARQLMDYAIVHDLVGSYTALLVSKKASKLQKEMAVTEATNSKKHNDSLMRKRGKYIAYIELDKSKVENIAMSYANGMTAEEITERYGIESKYVTQYAIERAIVASIVSDEIMEKIFKNCPKNDEFYFTKLVVRRRRGVS